MRRLTTLLLLLMCAPSLAFGWSSQITHPSQTDLALRLIEDSDTDGAYRRLYARRWWTSADEPAYYNPQMLAEMIVPGPTDHPAVIGAFSEGIWGPTWFPWRRATPDDVINFVLELVAFGQVAFMREANHYGRGLGGLQWRGFGEIFDSGLTNPDDRFGMTCPRGAGRYPSAEVWGAGNGACGNALGYAGAVDVYRHGTVEAMREGMRRIGHALHVLQDLGQPDHGRVIPNYKCSDLEDGSFLYDLAVMLAGSLSTSGSGGSGGGGSIFEDGSFAAAAETIGDFAWDYSAGMARDEALEAYFNEVGFNGYVRLFWIDILAVLSRGMPAILGAPSYAAFLADAEADAAAIAAGVGEGAPLGCRDSYTPSIDPDDDNPDWLTLAVDLNRRVIGRSAGLLMHYFEVVNPPPFAAEVRASQGVGGVGGAYTARWNDVLEPNRDLRWYRNQYSTSGFPTYAISHTSEEMVPDVLVRRDLTVSAAAPLVAGLDTTVRVRFAPNEVAPKAMRAARVRLLGREVELRRVSTGADGQWWQGTVPVACDATTGTRDLQVMATDAEAHLASRAAAGRPVGDWIDADPSTIAHADPADPTRLRGYEPGTAFFSVPVRSLHHRDVGAVDRVFGATGLVPGADAAVVHIGLEPATAALLDQGHRLDAFVDTDLGRISASALRRCVDIAWEVVGVYDADTGARVDPAAIGMAIELLAEGTHATVHALPTAATPPGRYRVQIEVSTGGLREIVEVEFEVVKFSKSLADALERFAEEAGMDWDWLGKLDLFRKLWLELRDPLKPPHGIDGCVPSPVVYCWLNLEDSLTERFAEWGWDAKEIDRIGAWLAGKDELDASLEFGVGLALLSTATPLDGAHKGEALEALKVLGLPDAFAKSKLPPADELVPLPDAWRK